MSGNSVGVRLYGIPVVSIVEKEDPMSHAQDTAVAELMEQLIAEGPDGMAQVFTTLFNRSISQCSWSGRDGGRRRPQGHRH